VCMSVCEIAQSVKLPSLTWEFASGDGHAGCGEVLGEELRLCGLP